MPNFLRLIFELRSRGAVPYAGGTACDGNVVGDVADDATNYRSNYKGKSHYVFVLKSKV